MLNITLWNTQDLAPDLYLEFVPKLPDYEQERVEKMQSIQRRQEFVLGRHLLRTILQKNNLSYSSELVLSEGYQKPVLKNSELEFNLSHSNKMIALAISKTCKIGLDLQANAKKETLKKVAERYFHLQEQDYIASLDEEEELDVLQKLWTLKEAHTKLNNGLLLQSLSELNLDLENSLFYSPKNETFDISKQKFYLSVLSKNKVLNNKFKTYLAIACDELDSAAENIEVSVFVSLDAPAQTINLEWQEFVFAV